MADDPYAPGHDAFPLAPESDQLPLEGLTVIDAGNLVAAPLAAGLLADFGADVITIEHPNTATGSASSPRTATAPRSGGR